MICNHLLPAIKKEFAGWEIQFNTPPHPIATFPARQKAVGNLLIRDDGTEVTICVENITHGHFSCYDKALTQGEREKQITEDVLDFLKALLSDNVLLFTSQDRRRGGWFRIDLGGMPIESQPDCLYFLWSKPFKPFKTGNDS